MPDVEALITNVVTVTHDPVARRRSYELLAEAFELSPGLAQAVHPASA